MLVKNWMSKPAITIDSNRYIQEAAKLMSEHNIGGLPVMEEEKLVGYISDIQVRRAAASEVTTLEQVTGLADMLNRIRIKSIMTKTPITIPDHHTVDRVAETLLEHKLSAAPVVDNEGRLVGVITQTDILRVLVSLTGVKQSGIHLAFQIEDRPGSIKQITDVVRKYGYRMVSILSAYDTAPSGYRNVYIRISDSDQKRLRQLKQELETKTKILYTVTRTGSDEEMCQK